MTNKNKTKFKILEPVKVGDNFVWAELEARASKQVNGGTGIFAKVALDVGTYIPPLGRQISAAEAEKLFIYCWIFEQIFVSQGERLAIDGNPAINTFQGVGCKGLAIAMMINENQKYKHNCLFMRDFVVVGEKIEAGQELTVYYGRDYNRRGMYSLNNNKYVDCDYPKLDNIKQPDAGTRTAIIKKYQAIIAEFDKPVTVQSFAVEVIFLSFVPSFCFFLSFL